MMNRVTKIRVLSQYHWLLDEISYLEECKKECRINKLSPKAIEYSDMPKGSGGMSDLSAYAAKIDMYERDIDALMQSSIDKKRMIMEWIGQSIEAQDRIILTHRYIDWDTFEQIGEKMGYGEKTIRMKHNTAIDNLPDNYEILKKFGFDQLYG